MTNPESQRPGIPDEPPAPEPTRPDMGPAPASQPHLPPAPLTASQPAYGPYAPVPPPAPRKSAGRTVLLVLLVAVLMTGGAAAGYFLLGSPEDEGRLSAEETTEPTPEEETPSTEESEPPPGETIPFESAGAQMPVPSDRWELGEGPGEDFDDMQDASSYFIQYEENWYATLMVGRYSVPGLPYSSDDAVDIAAELAGYWAEETSGAGENGAHTEPVTTETTVDDRPAVIAEAEGSWEASEWTSDTYERVIVVLIDIDGVNPLYGLAFIPESADAEYESVLAAFQAATFE